MSSLQFKSATNDFLLDRLRVVADWPQEGIQFADLGSLLSDPHTFRLVIAQLKEKALGTATPTKVAGIDARGFILAAPVAREIDAGLCMVRKKGKLPPPTLERSYELEYGHNTLTISPRHCGPQDEVLLIDDLLATGGTTAAAAALIQDTGARLTGILTLLELPHLKGRARLKQQFPQVPILSVLALE